LLEWLGVSRPVMQKHGAGDPYYFAAADRGEKYSRS
jgi:hypothetical protein